MLCDGDDDGDLLKVARRISLRDALANSVEICDWLGDALHVYNREWDAVAVIRGLLVVHGIGDGIVHAFSVVK